MTQYSDQILSAQIRLRAREGVEWGGVRYPRVCVMMNTAPSTMDLCMHVMQHSTHACMHPAHLPPAVCLSIPPKQAKVCVCVCVCDGVRSGEGEV